MKDIEKIKSEDLAAQVQDANPANFAIEQEVAALVGATVPQPTEPSADDARELGAQLLVFLRRALTPIQTALRTAVAAIYAHLDSRCTDYTPAAYASYQPLPSYDPMGTPPTPRTLQNLLTAITAFSARKISNGSATADGIPDGVSLAHILGTPSIVTEIKDDNADWQMTQAFPWSLFTNLTKVTLGCTLADVAIISGYPNITEFHLPNLKVIGSYPMRYYGDCIYLSGEVEHLVFDSLETWYIHRIWSPSLKTITFKEHVHFYGVNEYNSMFNTNQETLTVTFEKGSTYETTGYNSFLAGGSTNLKKFIAYGLEAVEANNGGCISGSYPALEEVLLPDCHRIVGYSPSFGSSNYANLKRLQFGTIHSLAGYFTLSNNLLLTDIEFGQGTDCNIDLGTWNPTDKGTTFIQNFKDHIALRLTANGSGKTLTLSQAVRDAIHAAEATYGIEAIIVTQKGWTLSPAPGASSQ